jgi:hypothetical protein
VTGREGSRRAAQPPGSGRPAEDGAWHVGPATRKGDGPAVGGTAASSRAASRTKGLAHEGRPRDGSAHPHMATRDKGRGDAARKPATARVPIAGAAPFARGANQARKGREIPQGGPPPASDAARPPKPGSPTRSGALWGGATRRLGWGGLGSPAQPARKRDAPPKAGLGPAPSNARRWSAICDGEHSELGHGEGARLLPHP